MIVLTNKSSQDFLNRNWVKKLQDAGIDMSDAKYCIHGNYGENIKGYFDVIDLINEVNLEYSDKLVPTYSFAELLYKLPEWHPQYGSLAQCKDAPFYAFYYKGAPTDSPMNCISEYPIEAAAQLLINCALTGLGYSKNISNK